MSDSLKMIVEYLSEGGPVCYPLLLVFLIISYTIGLRLSILFSGRNIDVRSLCRKEQKNQECVQLKFLNLLKEMKLKYSPDKYKAYTEWAINEVSGEIRSYSSILQTAVLLAPLLGLLGTVIGMIETFASLSNADLFNSSGGGIAGGISQALMTTQFGLLIAVPGVFLSRYLKKVEKKTILDILQIKEIFMSEEQGALE